MKKLALRYLVASCVLVLVPAVANAQVGQQLTDQSAAKQNQPGAQNTPSVTQVPQAGRVIPQQPDVATPPGQTGQVQRQVVPGQVGTTIQATPGREAENNTGSQNESQSLQKLVVKQLKIANDAQIEVSQMAVDKAKSDEVKQFAQMLIEDHRQLNQELTSFDSGKAGATRGQQNRPDQAASTLPAPNQPVQAAKPDQAPIEAGPKAASQQNDRLTDSENSRRDGGSQAGLVSQLTSIAEKASKNHTEMIKEDLQGREGNEFDMAFVGYQIACHSAAVAKLGAMDGVGTQELQAVIQKAEQRVSGHLDKAKQLAETLKNGNKDE